MLLTSAVSDFICAEEVEGGGAARSLTTSVGVSIHGFDLAEERQHGRAGWAVLTYPCDFAARGCGIDETTCQIAGVPPAAFIPSLAARAAKTAATALPRATPAAMSLGEARPERRAACCCSAALALISSTDVGKRSVSKAALTPASTASSEGYEGSPVAGISDLTLESDFEGRLPIVEKLVVPGGLEGFELRDGDVAVGTRGVGRIAEWVLRVREGVRGIWDGVASVGIW